MFPIHHFLLLRSRTVVKQEVVSQVGDVKLHHTTRRKDRSASGQLSQTVHSLLVTPDSKLAALWRTFEVQLIDLDSMTSSGTIRSPEVRNSWVGAILGQHEQMSQCTAEGVMFGLYGPKGKLPLRRESRWTVLNGGNVRFNKKLPSTELHEDNNRQRSQTRLSLLCNVTTASMKAGSGSCWQN